MLNVDVRISRAEGLNHQVVKNTSAKKAVATDSERSNERARLSCPPPTLPFTGGSDEEVTPRGLMVPPGTKDRRIDCESYHTAE